MLAIATARGRFLRVSPFKIRPLVKQIKGKSFSQARELLQFSPKLTAQYILKVLDSAAANAESVKKVSRDELFVSDVFVNEGPTLKRVEFRAMGRVNRIRKRSSHITIGLSKKGES